MKQLCKLCRKSEKLIKAHIIPKGFFKYLYPENDTRLPLHIIVKDGGYVNSSTGEYDPDILCAKCDNRIGKYDNYAQKIFLKSEPEIIPGITDAELINSIDYKKLKLFFISLLWRASISNRIFFKNIAVGPFEKGLCTLLENENPGGAQDFGVIVTRFKSTKYEHAKEKNITVPFQHRLSDGINVCVFYLPRGYKTYIKVDTRNFDETLTKIAIAPNRQLYVLNAGNFDSSPEFHALMNALRRRK